LIERYINTDKQTQIIWITDIFRVREKALEYNKMEHFKVISSYLIKGFQANSGFLKAFISFEGQNKRKFNFQAYFEIPPFAGTLTQRLHMGLRIFYIPLTRVIHAWRHATPLTKEPERDMLRKIILERGITHDSA